MSDQLAIFIDFENIALWAEREFFDFEMTNLIEHLQSRGPAVVKRAYADWSRFSRYRDAHDEQFDRPDPDLQRARRQEPGRYPHGDRCF